MLLDAVRMQILRMMTDKHKKLISAAGIALFLLLSLAIFWFVGKPFLAFVSEPEKFRLWVDGHGIWGRLAFLGMMLLQVFVAIIPGEPLEIGAGYAFLVCDQMTIYGENYDVF